MNEGIFRARCAVSAPRPSSSGAIFQGTAAMHPLQPFNPVYRTFWLWSKNMHRYSFWPWSWWRLSIKSDICPCREAKALSSGMRSPPARNANSNGDPIDHRLSVIDYRLRSALGYAGRSSTAWTILDFILEIHHSELRV